MPSIEERLADLEKREDENNKFLSEYEVNHKIEFFKPIGTDPKDIPYQTQVLEHLQAGKKVISLVGGNGIGKTTLGACIVGAACLGIQPWDGKHLPVPIEKPPVKVRVLCTDWEKHANVIVENLKMWLPAEQYTTSKNNTGVESKFTFSNKSTIELITNKQATTDHESWQGQIIWADEPFPQDKFIANLRGLRQPDKRSMGIFLITMTAVSEAWILDDIILNPDPAYASVTEVPQKANPYLSEEYLRVFASSLTENQKIARVDGGWLNLVGLVWGGFSKDVHVIDPFEVPTDWIVVPVVDYHPSHEIAIGYYAVDPFDRIYVIDETYGHLSPEQVGDDIIRKKTANAWRMRDCFIDPLSKGDMAYVKNRGLDIPDTFSVLKERLWRHSVELHVATKDKASGIRNVEKMLEGPNQTPTLFFFRNLDKIEKEGHLWEIVRWTYGDDNKPKDENDHFMENLYRMTLTGIQYTKFHNEGYNAKAETDFDPLAAGYGIHTTESDFDVWRS